MKNLTGQARFRVQRFKNKKKGLNLKTPAFTPRSGVFTHLSDLQAFLFNP
jgi:hypothetical protein